ncbi:hypothetical protein [Thalassomonas haliotis]|uniref:Uncharacterized protein n=1 Tax=Thalassomonas haliotis TaxID=485448 RepID=A0ABY7V8Y9_9GAMM|nr:hypothetical protein [Thalassomonas haliotis]WDE09372.1 hypothetical protein H3N35_13600 [Thalassomonas haliotis]
MSIEMIMDSLFDRRVENLPAEALAEVFDRLIWCEADNGYELCEVREKWLQGDSQERCAIALEMNDIFPFESIKEMKRVFETITKKWPQFQERCDYLIKVRDSQGV